jgi:DNA-binding CsgD family transcriptional regulator
MTRKVLSNLPALGILAFALCSLVSVHNLFAGHAAHPTPILWFAAALVELTSAWLCWQVTEQLRQLLRSKLSKEDRRFHAVLLASFGVMALLSLGLSTWANTAEFGNIVLGLAFPVLSVACAVGLSLPAVEAKWQQDKQRAKDEQTRESRRKAEEAQRIQQEAREKELSKLGNAERTYRALTENPSATQEQLAQALGISRRSVVNHLSKIEKAGLLSHNGNGAGKESHLV